MAAKVLVFQHHPSEHPGVFRDFFAEDGATVTTVNLDAGEPIPDLSGFDLLVVMGGAQDVWQEDAFPWLVAEKEAIREWVGERDKPFLGFCLGHQLLAEAMGGTVGKSATPEIGVLPVEKTEVVDPVFDAAPCRFAALHWHGAEVTAPPPGARVLARSPACAVQAFAVGACAYGVQFHLEATRETAPGWIEAYDCADMLEAANGPGAVQRLFAEAEAAMPEFNSVARAIYDAFMVRAGLRRADAA
ncbi:MAG: type 1 glutamine amidotransferase [Rhodobacteraceae bacterium]|nr:MAG: type 1 glutamine amidotransferase [Paracoccaceae bacterium]